MSNETNEFLIDLNQRLGSRTPGHNSAWELEINGGTIIEPTAFEPDPLSYRHDYYYNAINNILYRKITTSKNGITTAKWHKASE